MFHIYSIQYNRPEFIELQKRSFDKFIKEYKFVVIDNSIDPSIGNEIKRISEENNLEVIETVNKYDSRVNGNHGISHEVGINCFLDRIKNFHDKNDTVVLLDHDLFLISSLDKLTDSHTDVSIFTVKQERKHVYYLWPGLIILRLDKCPNIHELSLNGSQLIKNRWVPIDGDVFTDVGGHSYHYLKKYDEIKIFDVFNIFTQDLDQITQDHIFYHFHDGSQWSKYSNDFWNEKFNKIKNFLE